MRVTLLETIEEQHGQTLVRYPKGEVCHFSAERAAELIAAGQAEANPDPDYDAADVARQEALYAAKLAGEITDAEFTDALEAGLTVGEIVELRDEKTNEKKSEKKSEQPSVASAARIADTFDHQED